MPSSAQVLVFPSWRDNPYLNLLSLAAQAGGRIFLGSTTLDGLVLQALRLHRGDALHVHWTSPLIQEAEDAQDAERRLEKVRALLVDLRRRGIGIIWTLHNRLPHELRYRDSEMELYRLLAEFADAVHLMTPGAIEVLEDVVAIDPAKVRVIPHGSYEGIYDTGVDRRTARHRRGLQPTERAVLFLGQIRPYKGVDDLVRGAAAAAEHREGLVLMLAGVVKDVSTEEFMASVPKSLRTITQFTFVPDGEIVEWFRAADVMVLPYRAILNSGSAHLAATFRVPLVLPDEPHLLEQFEGQRWVAFFDRTRPAESIAEILADETRFSGLRDEDFARFTDPISPWAVSRSYADLLDSLSVS